MKNLIPDVGEERLHTVAQLNREARELLRADPPRARLLAEQARELLHDCYTESAEATSHFAYSVLLLASCNNAQNRYDVIITQASEALHLFNLAQNEIGRAEALLTIGGAYGGKGEYAAALERLHQALDLVSRGGERAAIGMIQEDMGRYYWFLGDTKKALEHLFNSLAIAEELQHFRGIALVLMDIGNVYTYTGECAQALEYYLRGLAIISAHQPGAWRERAGLLMNMASLFSRMGDYAHALEYYLESLSLQEKSGVPVEIAILLGNIGELYRDKGDYEQAEKYMKRALKVYEEINAQGERAFCLADLALLSLLQGDCPLALQYGTTSLELARYTGDKRTEMFALHTIGRVCMEQGNYEQALDSLQQALELSRSTTDTEGETEIGLTMGTLGIYQHRFGDTLECARQSLAIAGQNGQKLLMMKAHKLLADAYEYLGDTATALTHFKLFHDMEKTIFNEKAENQVQTLKVLHEVNEMQKEAEIYRLKNEQLKSDVDHMQQDLVMHALHLAQRTEALRKTRQELGRVDRSPQRTIRKGIRTVMQSLDDALSDEGVWQMFEQQFRQVHSSFIDTLTKLYPDLSATELKVCALIKIKMSSKEISRILNISPRSVDTYRYRIRQKLGLDPDTNLAQFVAEQA